MDVAAASEALDAALGSRAARGRGLYRVIEAADDADALAAAEIRVARFPGGRLGVIPALDSAADDASQLGAALC